MGSFRTFFFIFVLGCNGSVQSDPTIQFTNESILLINQTLAADLTKYVQLNIRDDFRYILRYKNRKQVSKNCIEILQNLNASRENTLKICSGEMPGKNNKTTLEVKSLPLAFDDELTFKYFLQTLIRLFNLHARNNSKANHNVNLINLTMTNCGLNEITLCQYEHTLRNLDLSNNKLKDFKGLRGLEQLRFFNISNNLINAISEKDFSQMINIQWLILSNNLIETISDNCFQNCPKLEGVAISHNRLKQLDFNQNCIAKLNVDGNELHCDIRRNSSKANDNYKIILTSGLNNLDKLLCGWNTNNNDSNYIIYVIIFPIIAVLIIGGVIVLYFRSKMNIPSVGVSQNTEAWNNDVYDEPEWDESSSSSDDVAVAGDDYAFPDMHEQQYSRNKSSVQNEIPIYSVVNKDSTFNMNGDEDN